MVTAHKIPVLIFINKIIAQEVQWWIIMRLQMLKYLVAIFIMQASKEIVQRMTSVLRNSSISVFNFDFSMDNQVYTHTYIVHDVGNM